MNALKFVAQHVKNEDNFEEVSLKEKHEKNSKLRFHISFQMTGNTWPWF